MARGIGMAEDAEVFRGVLVTLTTNGIQRTMRFGPYDKKGTAAGVATQRANTHKRWGQVILDKYVEKANVQWERVA